jgi:transcriptional regulator with PAS, ATPase and Fis domain
MDVRRLNGFPEAKEEGLLLESRNPAMLALLETIERAAAGDSTILLTGESGTGKDVLARQIHRWSPRRHGPFVVINCGTLSEPLMENELFGHVRGSFTGAADDKPGRLEAGGGGTMLFDDIADLPISLQAKFLRFVQDRSLERIGSYRTLKVDVRVVAASNRNLEAEVAAGRFRHDLYYRLNVITFTLPSPRTNSRYPVFRELDVEGNLEHRRPPRAKPHTGCGRSTGQLSMARQYPRASQCPDASPPPWLAPKQ